MELKIHYHDHRTLSFGPYPEPDASTPHLPTLFPYSIFYIIFLSTSKSSGGLFHSGFFPICVNFSSFTCVLHAPSISSFFIWFSLIRICEKIHEIRFHPNVKWGLYSPKRSDFCHKLFIFLSRVHFSVYAKWS